MNANTADTIARVDALPLDAEVGTEWIVGGRWVTIETPGMIYIPCGRCGGSGKTPFTWVFEGDCFTCGGAKGAGKRHSIEEENRLAKGRIRAAAREEAKRVAWVAKRDAEYDAIVADRPAVKAAVEAILAWDELVSDGNYDVDWDKVDANPEPFDTKLSHWLRDLRWTPRPALADSIQIELDRAARVTARKAADAAKAKANPAPTGTVEVEGKVVSLKWVANDFARGANSDTPKVLVVTDAGWKVYMTCPRALFDATNNVVGTRVRFTAELAEGKGKPDPGFRIGKRPRKLTTV